MKTLLLSVLLLSGCASTIADVKKDVAEVGVAVDQGAQKLQAALSVIRSQVQPFAAVAVSLCGASPVSEADCKAIDKAAGELFKALDEAQAALDLYSAGKGDFVAAYNALVQALDLASDYATKVLNLHAPVAA